MLAHATRRLRGMCFALALVFTAAHGAHAAPLTSEQARVSEAKQLFTRGSELFLARRFGEALDALNASYKLVPSPNSGLLIARCLRSLGKPVEAMEMFKSVETEARRRVADGEGKYGITAASAAVEGAEVRAGLGSLHVRVAPPSAGALLVVDGAPRALDAEGVAVVWRLPGEARASVKRPGAPEEGRVVQVPEGGEAQLEFAGPPADRAPPPPADTTAPTPAPARAAQEPDRRPRRGGGSWAAPAAWVAGALTLAGAAVFTGFGIASKNEYDALRAECRAPTPCAGAVEESQAETGRRNQLIANVGLVSAAAAAAATLTFVTIAATSSPTAARESRSPRLRIGLGAADVELPF